MGIFAATMRQPGIYAFGPKKGESYEAGSFLTCGGGKVIIGDSPEEISGTFNTGSKELDFEIIELNELPESYITVKDWLKGA